MIAWRRALGEGAPAAAGALGVQEVGLWTECRSFAEPALAAVPHPCPSVAMQPAAADPFRSLLPQGPQAQAPAVSSLSPVADAQGASPQGSAPAGDAGIQVMRLQASLVRPKSFVPLHSSLEATTGCCALANTACRTLEALCTAHVRRWRGDGTLCTGERVCVWYRVSEKLRPLAEELNK
jgi:hypothetical protein